MSKTITARRGVGTGLAALLACAIAFAPGAAAQSVEERLGRIEQVLNNQALLQMLQTVETLRREVQGLRGELEVQTHSIDQLKKRQRELYIDVDRRLQSMEAARVATGADTTGQVNVESTATVASAPAQPAAGAASPTPAASATASATPPLTGSAPATSSAPAASTPPAQPAPIASVTTPGQVTPPAASTGEASAIDPVKEQEAYQGAFDLLKTGRYDDAATAFQGFLGAYSGGQLADNAQYWLAETFYVTRRFDEARSGFATLLQRYPASQKLTHAMLKIGYIDHEMGRVDEARQILCRLAAEHPDSTAAGLARKRLQRIGGQCG